MTPTNFIRSSGWGLIVAALALLSTFLPLPESVSALPFLVAIGCITLGLCGLYARYSDRTGQAAKLVLRIGIVGGVASLVSILLMRTGYENGRPLMNFSMVVMFAGLFVFGLIALQKKPMSRGNGLPVLAGFWWPLIWINANIYWVITGQWLSVPVSISFALFLGQSLSLAGLGYVLQSDAPLEQVAV